MIINFIIICALFLNFKNVEIPKLDRLADKIDHDIVEPLLPFELVPEDSSASEEALNLLTYNDANQDVNQYQYQLVMKNEYTSNYSIGYIPENFLKNLEPNTFTTYNFGDGTKVSYAWLVRTFRLFEAVSDWLRVNKYGEYNTTVLMDSWGRSREIHSMSFSSDTGRLVSPRSLSYVKIINPKITDKDVNRLYTAISKVLKKWDEWYISNWTNRAITAVHEMTGVTRPGYMAIMVDENYYYYEFGSINAESSVAKIANKKVYSAKKVINGITCYEVYTLTSKPKSFEENRIDPNSATEGDKDAIKAVKSNGDTFVLEGSLDFDKLEKFREAKESGADVTIRGFGSFSKVAEKADLIDTSQMKIKNEDITNSFPVLDFIQSRSLNKQEQDLNSK